MAGDYNVTIHMTNTTVKQLKEEGWSLYGFKAVQASQQGGRPLVWFSYSNFLESVSIDWSEKYQAYISQSEIISDGHIKASSERDIKLGQKLTVASGGSILPVEKGDSDIAISIRNGGGEPLTCGISQQQGNAMTPLCAFPLHGNSTDVIAPIEKILLFFATKTVRTSSVVEKAYGKGVWLDLTAQNEVTLKYDINTSWDAGGAVWADTVPENTDLVPLLIVPNHALAAGK
jgi:hypothetical protein